MRIHPPSQETTGVNPWRNTRADFALKPFEISRCSASGDSLPCRQTGAPKGIERCRGCQAVGLHTGNDVPLLEFNNLSVVRGVENKQILRRISIRMEQGEHLALLGPNGCGKSSFINLVIREYYPFSGVDGYSFKILGREDWNVFDLRYLFGIVSDRLQSACYGDITGMETVLSGFFGSVGLYRAPVTARMRRKARDILDFLDIGHLSGLEISRMSTGEARRFLIARALVHDPKGLILDEPCNGLDLQAMSRFRSCVRKIAGTGISVILATHNLQDIIPEISRVILMKDGEFIADGAKKDMLESRRIGKLFDLRVRIKKIGAYYYALS